MSDLGVAEARGIVFESKVVVLFVDAEAAQAVGVGKFAKTGELVEAERGLQFVGDFEKCHTRIIAEVASWSPAASHKKQATRRIQTAS